MRRAGIFGWGVVAPRSPNVETFARNLETAESWLRPFNGFGPDNFLVGEPEFDFEAYRPWVEQRFKPNRFSQLEAKMGLPVKYAIGCFVQALGQNPGIEEELQRLGTRAHVYVGVGVGDLPTEYEQSINLYHAQRRWYRFWADPSRNSALRTYQESGEPPANATADEVPSHFDDVPIFERDDAQDAWWEFWAVRSPELYEYLEEYRAIEAIAVVGDVETGKLAAIKEKTRRRKRLQEKWGAPEPPWSSVSANMIWNIDNIPASQISMLGQIKGMAMAPVAACATFGVTLKLALDAIRSGEADAVVVGATDPPPHPLTVGAFYNARVIASDAQVSKPLTELRGTHIAGGATIWILGELEHMRARGFRPLGMEPVAVGVTSDADHIITPSKEGPTEAMRQALAAARAAGDGDGDGASVGSWDLHATATPGDFNEVEMVRDLVDDSVLITARKGTFGHGMAACGGWELTAQYLGYERGTIFPTPLAEGELNEQIGGVHRRFAFDASCPAPRGLAGKLSMGVGGINACVVSRPWAPEEVGPERR